MNRYKFTDASLEKAIKFIRGKTSTGPAWAKKHKEDLKIKGKKLYYKDKEIVTRERIDEVLRSEIYKKNGDVPTGRDSAFHILKQRYVGIPRRPVMEFLRKQRTIGETRAAIPKAKRAKGEKLKEYTFETDLVFLRKNDLEEANRRFEKMDVKNETYFVSTVEKITGLYRVDYVQTKDSSVVTPIVIKQMQDMAKQLKVSSLRKCGYRSDRGGEFDMKEIRKHVGIGKAKNVGMGSHVENKNRQLQQQFFRILRSRKAVSIKDAMKQAEKILNNTVNRIHKKTPNEMVNRNDTQQDIKEFNKKRKKYVPGDNRKEFEVGQHVRVLIKDKKPGIGYKSYKNETYSQKVYVISRKTKIANPPKYYVGNRWYTKETLLKSSPRDKVSDELVEKRDMIQTQKDVKERKAHHKKRMEEEKRKQAEVDEKKEKQKQTQKFDELFQDPPKLKRKKKQKQTKKFDELFQDPPKAKAKKKKQKQKKQIAPEIPAPRRSSRRQAGIKGRMKKLKHEEEQAQIFDVLDENDKIYQKLVKQAEEMNLSTKGDIPQLKKRIREYRRKQRTK